MSSFEKDYNWYIWKETVKDDTFRVMAFDQLPNYGFSSLYAISKLDAASLEQSGTTAKFKGSVWSKRLWVDIDNKELAEKAVIRSKNAGLDFVVFDSGNRSLHLGFLRNEPPSHWLPYQDKDWVKREIPEGDTSIYSHLHPFRRAGAKHESTGRFKVFIAHYRGKPITVRRISEIKSSDVVTAEHMNYLNDENMSVFDDQMIMRESTPLIKGDRHYSLLRLASKLHRRGECAALVLWWLAEVNKLCENPKPMNELEQIVEYVFQF